MADQEPPEQPLSRKERNGIAAAKSKAKKRAENPEKYLSDAAAVARKSRKKCKEERTEEEQAAFQANATQRQRQSRAKPAAAEGRPPPEDEAALGAPGQAAALGMLLPPTPVLPIPRLPILPDPPAETVILVL